MSAILNEDARPSGYKPDTAAAIRACKPTSIEELKAAIAALSWFADELVGDMLGSEDVTDKLDEAHDACGHLREYTPEDHAEFLREFNASMDRKDRRAGL